MSYYYKPKKLKSISPAVYKKLIKSALLSLGLLIFCYFWVVTVIPNINIVWDIFKPSSPTASQNVVITLEKPQILEIPEYTKNDSFSVKGFSRKGVTVTLFIGDREISKTLADTDGAFEFTDIPLQKEKSEVFVEASESKNDQIAKSEIYTITQDKKGPEIGITKPENSKVEDIINSYKIIGSANELCKSIKINGRFAQMLFDGSFEIVVELNEGANNFKIEAEDRAGNIGKRDLYINFSKTEP